ncbi:SidA/IucD/PvdA family monooxygenase [Allokutzneria sp. A3M-2-11 16]|uniref:lysine N(6)-hydroxylase/L-ornithine N(5)-oxygenase family protein n=1 Tax=Allokutzneria sp. A3M-2-11 16 TaxID=2962043 RepID=UPI0020B67E4B|nr:SidA/IucD/PvdA family monooxygenase [Allokutzneria sp. A3M-2-11 16]MCP3798443.1 SidA/IucD/PvdA family monooxygenase [Allokutzneria sp. A3M-2-11 16]
MTGPEPSMQSYDLIGIGVGPSNLSLAALAQSANELTSRFYEIKPRFEWHPGLMLPEAELQVSFLKDLVTLIDPTSPYSYLNFLHHEGRIFRALIANGLSSSRQEFEQYYRWVAEQLPSIRWGQRVKSVTLVEDHFEVACECGDAARTTTLTLGSGQEPHVPDFAATLKGDQVLHSSELLQVRPATSGRRVMVVGAGQSGAEVVNFLISDDAALPESLTWVSSRPGFQPIDDSPFTNEWFVPEYVDHFQSLSSERRSFMLGHQRLASDGVSESLLRKIYRRLYQLDIGGGRLRHRLVANRRVVDLRRNGDQLAVGLHDADRSRPEHCAVDVVIFCTGYRSRFPDYLEPLRERIATTADGFEVRADYSLNWDGPPNLRIYVQNFAEHSHGVSDPNLSLSAWRSARILNSILGREHYRVDGYTSTTSWSAGCG